MDMTLQEAFKSSCIWYFRKVTDETGPEMVQAVLNDLAYGNCDISAWEGSGTNMGGLAELNGFWLESSLLISPMEQVDSLVEIFVNGSETYTNEIPILKDLMLTGEKEDDRIYGKTGTGNYAWFVGFAEKSGKAYYFSFRLDALANGGITGQKAQEIANQVISSWL